MTIHSALVVRCITMGNFASSQQVFNFFMSRVVVLMNLARFQVLITQMIHDIDNVLSRLY